MKRSNLFLSLTLVAALAGAVAAQECGGAGKDCGGCPKAQKAPATLAARIKAIEDNAANGCETSAARLRDMERACGVENADALRARIAMYEKHATAGCEIGRNGLARVEAVLDGTVQQPALSARVEKMTQFAGHGCETSKATLASLEKECGCETAEALHAKVVALETAAGGGCAQSKARLSALEAKMPVFRMPLSARVKAMAASAGYGCGECVVALEPLMKQCQAESAEDLVGKVTALETNAGSGCETSAKHIAKMEKCLDGGSCAGEKKGCGTGGCGRPCDQP